MLEILKNAESEKRVKEEILKYQQLRNKWRQKRQKRGAIYKVKGKPGTTSIRDQGVREVSGCE